LINSSRILGERRKFVCAKRSSAARKSINPRRAAFSRAAIVPVTCNRRRNASRRPSLSSMSEQVERHAKARFVTGLSATVTRKDGHHPIIFMQCGPLRHHVNAREQAAARPFEHSVLVRPTGFRALRVPNPDLRAQFRELTDELVCDEGRTRLICREIVQAVRDGRPRLC
jgi:hypothetical protein